MARRTRGCQKVWDLIDSSCRQSFMQVTSIPPQTWLAGHDSTRANRTGDSAIGDSRPTFDLSQIVWRPSYGVGVLLADGSATAEVA